MLQVLYEKDFHQILGGQNFVVNLIDYCGDAVEPLMSQDYELVAAFAPY
ncbi:hypothetical protein [Dulcicalothrix desertica]|nr:hypothetical protein [Dulcicalothrix desertica]